MKIVIFFTFFFFSITSLNYALSGDIDAGKARHGPAGMGLASYPKIQGKEIAYLTDRLQTYRDGKRIGPNSDLMIMMAMPLSDEEIANLAAYLSSVPIK